MLGGCCDHAPKLHTRVVCVNSSVEWSCTNDPCVLIDVNPGCRVMSYLCRG
jgi:hypothetical protein